jgi:hypothetical protein
MSMRKINDGGLAFPFIYMDESRDHLGQMIEPGMTKREEFARTAMGSFLIACVQAGTPCKPKEISALSVEFADALVAELNKNGPAPSYIATGEIG